MKKTLSITFGQIRKERFLVCLYHLQDIFTEDKFITRKGFLSIEEDELDLYRVIDKKLVLPFGQRMFGCGTIVMNVKDVDTPIKEVKSIKAPRDVLAQLDKYININRDRYRVRGRDMVGGDGGHCHDHDDFDINDDII